MKVELELTMNTEEFTDWVEATPSGHFFKLTVLNSTGERASVTYYQAITKERFDDSE